MDTENYVTIDRQQRRVVIRAQGQWSPAQAERWYADMESIHGWSLESGRPITLFADLQGLILHTQEVSRRVEDSVLLMRDFPIDRYALIVPSFLMRMQCRRLLAGIAHSYFDTAEAARRWLGWKGEWRSAAA